MMQFKGFKPEAMKKIQGSLGFQGYAEEFDKYLEDNPDKKAMMDMYEQKAIEMAKGGYVSKYATGGVSVKPETTGSGETVIAQSETGLPSYINTDAQGNTLPITDMVAQQAYQPALPTGTEVKAGLNVVQDSQLLDKDTGIGQVGTGVQTPQATAGQADTSTIGYVRPEDANVALGALGKTAVDIESKKPNRYKLRFTFDIIF